MFVLVEEETWDQTVREAVGHPAEQAQTAGFHLGLGSFPAGGPWPVSQPLYSAASTP